LLQDTTGSFVALALEGSGVGVDSISVSRCDLAAPSYTPLLLETFNRADATTNFGGPEMPASASWTASGSDMQIASNALEIIGHGSLRAETQHYENQGLRLRTAARFGALGWLVFWYNLQDGGERGNGFDVWRENDTSVFIEYARGEPATRQSFTLNTAAFYYIQFDVNDDVGVVTFRSGSYEGPILFTFAVNEITQAPVGQTAVQVGNTWSNPSTLTIDEVRIDRYVP
jgi:hypothetical protein